MRPRRLIYSASCKYAIRALIFLSHHPEGAASKNIAYECGLSPEFLAATLKTLARNNILDSVKGAAGGFFLRRDPVDICLADIVRAIDGEDYSSDCAMGYAKCPIEPDAPCAVHQRWQEMKTWIKEYLRETTIAELAQHSECGPWEAA